MTIKFLFTPCKN